MRNTVGGLFVKGSIGRLPIVDVRPAAMYAESHIPTAQNVDLIAMQEAGGNWEKNFVKKIDSMGLKKGTEFIVYCQTGQHAKIACDLLESKGYDQLRDYQGSYLDWISDSRRPVEGSGASA